VVQVSDDNTGGSKPAGTALGKDKKSASAKPAPEAPATPVPDHNLFNPPAADTPKSLFQLSHMHASASISPATQMWLAYWGKGKGARLRVDDSQTNKRG